MATPIRDPPTPYLGPIHDFAEGTIIRIQGFTSPTSSRFNINLQTGSESTADIALHVSIRLLEGYVARNSQDDGAWGDEQSDGQLAIAPGQRFEILILCGATDFKIAINGNHFCEFPQRIRASKITHLSIDGDVSLSVISVEGGQMTSTSSTNVEGGSQNQFAPQAGGYGPPQGQYGPPQGQYGPPQGQYGPPQGQYGPPQGQYGAPQGNYGQQQGYGNQGGYGGPPGAPPGHQEESGLESFLGSASSVIAGAISSGMADKLISSLTSGGAANQHGQNNPQQQQQPQFNNPYQQQQPAQPAFSLPQLGGQGSLGGLGSVGSLLTSFAEQVLQPPKKDGHH